MIPQLSGHRAVLGSSMFFSSLAHRARYRLCFSCLIRAFIIVGDYASMRVSSRSKITGRRLSAMVCSVNAAPAAPSMKPHHAPRISVSACIPVESFTHHPCQGPKPCLADQSMQVHLAARSVLEEFFSSGLYLRMCWLWLWNINTGMGSPWLWCLAVGPGVASHNNSALLHRHPSTSSIVVNDGMDEHF